MGDSRMNGKSWLTRGLIALCAGVLLATGSPSAAQAKPLRAEGAPSLETSAGERVTGIAAAFACPAIGQRVKTSSSATVYVVGPDFYLYAIPGDVYFRLWDDYAGIITNNDLPNCYNLSNPRILYDGQLVKLASAPQVYIWDGWLGRDRWIVSGDVFNKYAFSWGKVQTVPVVFPGTNWTG